MSRRLSRRLSLATAAVLVGVLLATPAPASERTGRGEPDSKDAIRRAEPLVIGHRGASGYRPEHTLASYELAARMGADYIEPDLVATKDGVLVARHENEIGGTTDVADRAEFAARRTTKVIDGQSLTGWFTEDFTLAELRTLRAKERIPDLRQENTVLDGRYQVPTFAEVLALRARLSKELRREVGVYPEIKHPTFFRSVGLPLEPLLVDALQRAGLNRPNAPVFVQCFELTPLQRMVQELKLRTNTVFLTSASGGPADLVAAGTPRTYAELLTPASLREISAYVDGIGPAKAQVIPVAADGAPGTPTSLVADAHAAGLLVHPYTFRAENTFLPPALRSGTDPADFGDLLTEIRAFLDAGVDGFFTDHPDLGVIARDEWVAGRR